MKYLMLSFLLLAFYSCNLIKKIYKPDVIELTSDIDTIINNKENNNNIEMTIQDAVLLTSQQPIIINEVNDIDLKPDVNNAITKPPNTVSIIDATDNSNTSKGIIAYSIPTEMIVGQKYKIRVRITKDRAGKNILIIGDRNIPINDVSVDSKIIIEDIRVEKVMISELIYDESTFLVSELSSKVQNIEDKGYTEWSWFVSPLKSGKGYLKLIIKVRIDGSDAQKDIIVFDKNIDVLPDRIWSFKSWFSKYWQWLLSTMVIPFGIWLYKRKKKE
jgi:hypothetical protein